MKRFVVFTLLIALFVFAGAPPLAHAAGKKIRVAVMNFANNSTWTWWGDHLGEAANDEFTTQLVNTGLFTVIERAQLQSILAEQGLGASGAVAASTAPKIGKLLGAQLIFTGSITSFSIKKTGGSFMGVGANNAKAESKLDVRMIDTSTGEVLLVATGEGSKNTGGFSFHGTSFQNEYDEGVAHEALRPAIQQVTAKVVAKAPSLANLAPASGSGKIVDVDTPKSVYIDGGSDSGVNVGDVYAVYRVTKEIKDEDGNVLDTVTDKVGEILVTKVLGKSSICETRSGSVKKGDQYRKE